MPLYFFFTRRPPLHRDGWFFMIVRLMSHGDLLCLDLPAEFFVCEPNRPNRQTWFLFPEDISQVVQETNHAGSQGRTLEFIDMILEVLGVLVALGGVLGEPLQGSIPVLGNILPQQVQLSEGILGIFVSLLSGRGQPADGPIRILGDIFALEEQFSKTVLHMLISTQGRAFQPSDGGDGITR